MHGAQIVQKFVQESFKILLFFHNVCINFSKKEKVEMLDSQGQTTSPGLDYKSKLVNVLYVFKMENKLTWPL